MPREQTGPDVPAGQKDPMTMLREIRAALSSIFHDVNNPLAIISGNAQFLVELTNGMEVDEELVQPIRDIEEASRRVAERLRELARLKEAITRYVGDAEAD